jgi:hypothetical protein
MLKHVQSLTPVILYPLHSTCTVINPCHTVPFTFNMYSNLSLSYCTLYIQHVQSLTPVMVFPLHSTCTVISPCHTVPFKFNMTVWQGLMTVHVECKGYSMTGLMTVHVQCKGYNMTIQHVQSLTPVILYPLHSTCTVINPCHTVPFTFNKYSH